MAGYGLGSGQTTPDISPCWSLVRTDGKSHCPAVPRGLLGGKLLNLAAVVSSRMPKLVVEFGEGLILQPSYYLMLMLW